MLWTSQAQPINDAATSNPWNDRLRRHQNRRALNRQRLASQPVSQPLLSDQNDLSLPHHASNDMMTHIIATEPAYLQEQQMSPCVSSNSVSSSDHDAQLMVSSPSMQQATFASNKHLLILSSYIRHAVSLSASQESCTPDNSAKQAVNSVDSMTIDVHDDLVESSVLLADISRSNFANPFQNLFLMSARTLAERTSLIFARAGVLYMLMGMIGLLICTQVLHEQLVLIALPFWTLSLSWHAFACSIWSTDRLARVWLHSAALNLWLHVVAIFVCISAKDWLNLEPAVNYAICLTLIAVTAVLAVVLTSVGEHVGPRPPQSTHITEELKVANRLYKYWQARMEQRSIRRSSHLFSHRLVRHPAISVTDESSCGYPRYQCIDQYY